MSGLKSYTREELVEEIDERKLKEFSVDQIISELVGRGETVNFLGTTYKPTKKERKQPIENIVTQKEPQTIEAPKPKANGHIFVKPSESIKVDLNEKDETQYEEGAISRKYAKLNRNKVINGLISLLDSGLPVRLTELESFDPNLYIVFNPGTSTIPLFTGIIEARREAALFLREREEYSKAEEMDRHNKIVTTGKVSPGRSDEVKELIEKLSQEVRGSKYNIEGQFEIRDDLRAKAIGLMEVDEKPIKDIAIVEAKQALVDYTAACFLIADRNEGLIGRMLNKINKGLKIENGLPLLTEDDDYYITMQDALVRAAIGFDLARRTQFSTYACNAIIKAMNRQLGKDIRRQKRFGFISFTYQRDGEERDLSTKIEGRSTPVDNALNIMGLRNAVQSAIAYLAPEQREIIEYRFGLNGKAALTLDDIGKIINLTKERVRQIQNKAFDDMRAGPVGELLDDYLPKSREDNKYNSNMQLAS